MVEPNMSADLIVGRKSRRRSVAAAEVGVAENLLSILDDAHDTHYSHDDRLAFLEAVRATSVAADEATPPTVKMCETIFQIFRMENSLELVMQSFQLLNVLEQSYPRVYLDAASKSSSTSHSELVIDKKAWSPFALNLESERGTSNVTAAIPIDSSAFHLLIQDLAGELNKKDVQPPEIKSVKNMLLFQHLVNALDGEFLARSNIYQETMDWNIMRESTVNLLLGSRRLSYKGFVKDCLSIICGLHEILAGFGSDLNLSGTSTTITSKDSLILLALAATEVREGACTAMKKLMFIIMELDLLKKQADKKGLTTRVDGVRTPLLEIILDELTYDDEKLKTFLQVFDNPKWKLEFILQYFAKYTPKPIVRTRRSLDYTEDTTIRGTLRSFVNVSNVRSIVKKISADVVQILLAHSFQAHMSISKQHYPFVNNSNLKGQEVCDKSLREISEEVISAFNSLRKHDRNMEMLPIAREALFVASTVLSTKS